MSYQAWIVEHVGAQALRAGLREPKDQIELSPVSPFDACSAVGPTDQDRVLSALRMIEVVSVIAARFGAASVAPDPKE